MTTSLARSMKEKRFRGKVRYKADMQGFYGVVKGIITKGIEVGKLHHSKI